MEITLVELSADTACLKLFGRLDTNTAPAAQESFIKTATDYANVVLDFADLKYVSSAGLRSLLATQKLVTKKKGTMVLENVDPSVQEVFEVTGFSSILTIR